MCKYLLLTHQFYAEKISKKGKPQPNEYTILASFVLLDKKVNDHVVITDNNVNMRDGLSSFLTICSVGTGTKCIGHDLIEKDMENGFLLHDCHAEVMARRGFMKFLYSLLEHENCCHKYFDWTEENKRWKLKENFELLMILTELPCM